LYRNNSTPGPFTDIEGPIIDLRAIPVISPNAEGVRLGPVLRRHRLSIFVIALLCLGTALFASFLQTPLYRAKVVLEVQGPNPEFLNIKGLDPTTPADSITSSQAYLATQAQLIRTETLAHRVVEQMQLTNEPAFFTGSAAMAAIRRFFGIPERRFPTSEGAAIGTLLSRINVKTEGESDLISITVDSPDAALSSSVANEISKEYMEQEQEGRWTEAMRVGKWLTAQLEDFRLKLQDSERELQRYADDAALLFTDDHTTNVAEEKLREIQRQLTQAEGDLAEKQSQIELVSTTTADSLPRVLDDGPLRDLKSRLADLRRQYVELSATLTPSHYKVERVKAELVEVEDQLNRERNTILRRIRNEYDASAKRHALVKANYQHQVDIVSEQATRAVRYNVLKREVETNRQLYSSILQKVKESSMIAAIRTSYIRVVDPAQKPQQRYRPNYVQNILFGLVAAFMCSSLFVLASERTNRRIRNPGETEQLKIRELGAIPSSRSDRHVRKLFRNRTLKQVSRARTGHVLPLSADLPAVDQRLVTWSSRRTVMAEAFRSAAVSIQTALDSDEAPRVIVFTSAHARSGKTTTAANVAIAMAGCKREKLLLVDGDLRRPKLHALFGVERQNGLGDVLSDEAPIAVCDLAQFIRQTAIPGVHLMPAGSFEVSDALLLQSERLYELVERLRGEYSVILLDSPPLLQLPDARLISTLADGTVLVCRAGQTTFDEIAESSKVLHQHGVTLLGTILNEWNPMPINPGYYRSYYSDYPA